MLTNDTRKPVSRLETWRVAVRPFAYSGSAMPVILGTAVAYYAGFPPRGLGFVLTLVGVLCFHTAANLLNDCFDYRRGLDTEVNPGSGAIVRGWLTPGQVYRAALLFLAAGVLCGLVLVRMAGWTVFALGALGTVLVVGYTRAGLCFKYAGLGDFAIFMAFGVLPVFGAFWVQARTFAWPPVLWSLPLVSYTVGILHANNWRDLRSDRPRGCRTVAGALGERGSAVYYGVLMLGPFALVGAYVLIGLARPSLVAAPLPVLGAFLALPAAVRLTRARRAKHPQLFAMLDARTAQVDLLFGALLSAAFVLARLTDG